MQLLIRTGCVTDHALVLDSIISTYRQSPHAQGANNAVLASLVEPLLSSPKWALAIACPEDDADTILGFVLYECTPRPGTGPAVAWLQVKAPWRRHGIGIALLRHAVGPDLPRELHTAFMVQRVGPDAPTVVDLAKKHGITLRFRPYLPLQAVLDAAS